MVTSEDSDNASVPLDVLCCVEFIFSLFPLCTLLLNKCLHNVATKIK